MGGEGLGKGVTAHPALELQAQTVQKQPDGSSWDGRVSTALLRSKAELLPCAPLWMCAAPPWAMQCWGQEERSWHCASNHGKVQHFLFKTYKLNTLC